jgi:glycosyltransferase involved in cell wall biosynthesis
MRFSSATAVSELICLYFPNIYLLASRLLVKQTKKGPDARFRQFARGQVLKKSDIRERNYNRKAGPPHIEVSVVISNFNYQNYISNAIASAAQEKDLSIEIIIVDDNSQDDSVAVINETLANIALPSTLLHLGKNTGVSKARNIGIQRAKGDFIFILDADNEVSAGALTKLTCQIKHSNAIAAYGWIAVINESTGQPEGKLSNQPYNLTKLTKGNYIDVMALYRKDVLEKVGGFDQNLLLHGWNREDWELWLRLGKLNKPILFVDEQIGTYTKKSDSLLSHAQLTKSQSEKYIRKKLNLYESA